MNTEEAVAALDAIDWEDGEEAHSAADEILRAVVPVEIREAYVRVMNRANFWAFA